MYPVRFLAAILLAALSLLGLGTLSPAAADTVTITPVADAYVSKSTAKRNYGTADPLEVLGGATTGDRQSYLRFKVPVPAGETVTSATLRLSFSKVALGKVLVHATSNNWTESGLTRRNRPAAGAELARVTAPATTGFLDIPLPASTIVNGGNSFVVASTNQSASMRFRSREHATARPQLVVTTAPASVPPQAPPVVTTGKATGASDVSAVLNGTVDGIGAPTTYAFELGTTTSYGMSVPATPAELGAGSGAVDVSQVVEGLAPSTTYHYRLRATNSAGTTLGADATFTTGSTTTAPTSGLLQSKALIYGSEWAAWDPDSSQATAPGVMAKTVEAEVPIIRYALYDCFTGMTCGNDDHAGTISRTDFRTSMRGITQDARAVPWLKMLPIARDTIGGVADGSVFCPHWSDDATLDDNLPTYKAMLDELVVAGYTGPVVIESNNEMEYTCWRTWQSQGAPITSAGSVGVSDRLGDHFAATMPALRAYARTLGFSEVVVGGYVGISGGPGWGQSCAADATQPYGYACGYQSRWVHEFAAAVKAAYLANGSNPDYLPDFLSMHAYVHGPDFSSTAGYEFDDRMAFAYFRTWLVRSRAVLRSVFGTTVGDPIQFSISEWSAGVSRTDAWSGWATPSRVARFYDGWFEMLRGDGRTTGDGTRYWNANQFLIAGNSDTGTGRYYNWIRRDGSVPAWYTNIKNASTGDPLR